MQNSTKDVLFRFILLHDAFSALRVLSDDRLLRGVDEWRHPTGKDSLLNFDKDLPEIVRKQPPSKFGHADQPSLWTSTHFMVALPALSYAIMMYGTQDAKTRRLSFSEKEVGNYFVAFPHILRHYRESQEFMARHGEATQAWWDEMLHETFKDISSDQTMPEIVALLPLYLRGKVNRILAGKQDSLEGRLILAYLLSQGIPAEQLHIDTRAVAFLSPIGAHAAKSLYERLIHAQQELAGLDEYLAEYDSTTGITLGPLLGLVSWYARPHLVEMIIPGLVGAAEAAIASLNALFTHIISQGGPDYTRIPLPALPSIRRFRETQSLVEIGRLSLMLDLLGKERDGEQSPGTILRNLAISLYDEGERFQAWGNPNYYVPSTREDHQSFIRFRQDIGDILYSAGIISENQITASGFSPHPLKKLAKTVVGCRSLAGIRAHLKSNRALINSLVADWTKRYPGQERLRIVRFVSATFGLESTWPTPVSLAEIDTSFAGSHYDGRVYHVVYREAAEQISLNIDLSNAKSISAYGLRTVTYHLDDKNLHKTNEGIPYSAWLEIAPRKTSAAVIIPVPGRGSFDPFGRIGNLHAGEVVGFGCSVHHAALAIILAELASLGAGRADLQRLTTAFMHINEGVHERRDLAAYQLAQTIAAFTDDQSLSYAQYLSKHAILVDDKRPYLAHYFKVGKPSLDWAEPQLARLTYGYPELYPYKKEVAVDPRLSWYDGNSVKLVEAGGVAWQALTC